ncbi:unnamed protein product [Amoebophrya sp. A25]|nr:unnamed protein product [Amoebophrya sp. A25]|eukprot:GSA25T00019795001.1
MLEIPTVPSSDAIGSSDDALAAEQKPHPTLLETTGDGGTTRRHWKVLSESPRHAETSKAKHSADSKLGASSGSVVQLPPIAGVERTSRNGNLLQQDLRDEESIEGSPFRNRGGTSLHLPTSPSRLGLPMEKGSLSPRVAEHCLSPSASSAGAGGGGFVNTNSLSSATAATSPTTIDGGTSGMCLKIHTTEDVEEETERHQDQDVVDHYDDLPHPFGVGGEKAEVDKSHLRSRVKNIPQPDADVQGQHVDEFDDDFDDDKRDTDKGFTPRPWLDDHKDHKNLPEKTSSPRVVRKDVVTVIDSRRGSASTASSASLEEIPDAFDPESMHDHGARNKMMLLCTAPQCTVHTSANAQKAREPLLSSTGASNITSSVASTPKGAESKAMFNPSKGGHHHHSSSTKSAHDGGRIGLHSVLSNKTRKEPSVASQSRALTRIDENEEQPSATKKTSTASGPTSDNAVRRGWGFRLRSLVPGGLRRLWIFEDVDEDSERREILRQQGELAKENQIRKVAKAVNKLRAQQEGITLFKMEHNLPETLNITKLGEPQSLLDSVSLNEEIEVCEIFPFPDCMEVSFLLYQGQTLGRKNGKEKKYQSADFHLFSLRTVGTVVPSLAISAAGHQLVFRFLVLDDHGNMATVDQIVYVPPSNRCRKISLIVYGEKRNVCRGGGGGGFTPGLQRSRLEGRGRHDTDHHGGDEDQKQHQEPQASSSGARGRSGTATGTSIGGPGPRHCSKNAGEGGGLASATTLLEEDPSSSISNLLAAPERPVARPGSSQGRFAGDVAPGGVGGFRPVSAPKIGSTLLSSTSTHQLPAKMSGNYSRPTSSTTPNRPVSSSNRTNGGGHFSSRGAGPNDTSTGGGGSFFFSREKWTARVLVNDKRVATLDLGSGIVWLQNVQGIDRAAASVMVGDTQSSAGWVLKNAMFRHFETGREEDQCEEDESEDESDKDDSSNAMLQGEGNGVESRLKEPSRYHGGAVDGTEEQRDIRLGGRRSILQAFGRPFQGQMRLFRVLTDFGANWREKIYSATIARPSIVERDVDGMYVVNGTKLEVMLNARARHEYERHRVSYSRYSEVEDPEARTQQILAGRPGTEIAEKSDFLRYFRLF